jgi:hypothetical protein
MMAIYLLWGCGDPPTAVPTELRGSIQVEGRLTTDSSLVDPLHIVLDGDTLGYFTHPIILEDLYAGVHRIDASAEVASGSDTVLYSNLLKTRDFTVFENETTVATCSLQILIAPDFSLYDIDTTLVTLSTFDAADEIVILYFFEST